MLGGTKGRANRLANADHANLVRVARASDRDTRAAARLAADGRLEALPKRLREAAEVRLRHPSLSLRDLGAKCRPPITKGALHARLRKLGELDQS